MIPGLPVTRKRKSKRRKRKAHRFTAEEQAIINRSMAARGLKKGWTRGMDD